MPVLAEKNACELLDADHIAVKHLFVEYARLAVMPDADATSAQRTRLALKICDELSVHAQLEEEIFYPALRTALAGAKGLLDEAIAEHAEAKQLIADIRAAATADETMDTLVAELNVAIEHHVKEERDELFSKARAAPELDLAGLGERMSERQRELQAGPLRE